MTPSRPDNPSIFEALDELPGLRESLLKAGGAELLKIFLDGREREQARPQEESVRLDSPTLVSAALKHTYQLDELNANSDQAHYLLTNSSLLNVDGTRRLRLSNHTRADILAAAQAAGTLASAFQTSSDPVMAGTTHASRLETRTNAWLRNILQNRAQEGAVRGPTESRARLAALDALSDFGPASPRLFEVQEAEGQLGLAELLAPLQVLIGVPDTEELGQDRFVGRESEIRALRKFVDVLESQSSLESIQRGAARLTTSLRNRLGSAGQPLLELIARGGLGKSTLMAKFVLDHACNSRTPFPFVYLDFDRSTLQPRDPANLLSECARQVSLQFPEHRAVMDEIRLDSAKGVTGKVPETARRLREVVEQILQREHAPIFLIVLDTMEVVQNDERDLRGVCDFLSSLTRTSFAHLRVVAAGRAEVPELREMETRWATTRIHLGALSIKDGRDMVGRLGRTLLQEQWKDDWNSRIAGTDQSSIARREPLSLRVAVEFVRNAAESEREALVAKIEQLGDTDFVGQLYCSRVLEHIRPIEARKLAWPGLIVRRIDQEILLKVLAPICGLSGGEVDRAFEHLAKEVWIVERDGSTLRHRPDLRARTLPWMRRHDYNKFRLVCDAMVDHYAGPHWQSEEGREEYVYYRLLRGDSPIDIDDMRNHALDRFLATVRDDFEPGSEAWLYVQAWIEPTLLPRNWLLKLPDTLAWEHVARVGSDLRMLDDERIRRRVLDMAERAERSSPDRTIGGTYAERSILIKSGRWNMVSAEPHPLPDDPTNLIPLCYFLARNPGIELSDNGSELFFHLLKTPDWQSLAFSLPLYRNNEYMWRELDREIFRRVRDTGIATATAPGAVRAATIFGDACVPLMCSFWEDVSGPDGKMIGHSIASGELAVLAEHRGTDANLEIWQTLRKVTQSFFGDLKGSEARRIDDVEVLAPARIAMSILVSQVKQGGPGGPDGVRDALETLQLLLAQRDPDWCVPVGYLLAKLNSEGPLHEALLDTVANYNSSRGLLDSSLFRKTPRFRSALRLAQYADEAGDLDGLMQRALKISWGDTKATDDLFRLADCYRKYKQIVQAHLMLRKQNISRDEEAKKTMS